MVTSAVLLTCACMDLLINLTDLGGNEYHAVSSSEFYGSTRSLIKLNIVYDVLPVTLLREKDLRNSLVIYMLSRTAAET